ncbi:hypothetical protein EDB19DRAFT_1920448 [Suillus lakei]|nr:hypothetical protein EDB19DRAFT_1920448 [Suillus lakei]
MTNVTANDNAWTSVLNVFGDVIYIDIRNAISVDNTYCFNLNLDSAGPKKFVFRIQLQTSSQDCVSDDSVTESESGEEENGDYGDDTDMKTEDVDAVEVGIEIKVEDEDLTVVGPDFDPVDASPCTLLTRRVGNAHPDPENPTAPWSYYVKKRTEAQDLAQEEISVEGDQVASS